MDATTLETQPYIAVYQSAAAAGQIAPFSSEGFSTPPVHAAIQSLPVEKDSEPAQAAASQYTPVRKSIEFGRHFLTLESLRTDGSLWPDKTVAPQEAALRWAAQVLRTLEDDMFSPSKVVATIQGGVAICFVRGDIYADIECFNDGVILGATSDRHSQSSVWDVESSASGIASAISRIRGFLDSKAATTNDTRKPGARYWSFFK